MRHRKKQRKKTREPREKQKNARMSLLLAFFHLKFLRRLFPSSCCSDPPTLTDSNPPFPSPQKQTPFRLFSWPEIQSFTNSFTSTVIGVGGFSTVYLARLPDSSLAAVKLHRSGHSDRLLRAFKHELHVLLRLSNPLIVRLIGYGDNPPDGSTALLFEYMPGGTLRRRLAPGEPPLPWNRRLTIALRVAEALHYLHEGGELPILHGDITPANVLLDGRRGVKLCDFGSARVGFSAAVKPAGDPIIGSPGYTDPYYLRTGIFSKKSDVYSFGVLLLELVTGLPGFRGEDGGLTAAEAAAVRGVDPKVGGGVGEEEAAAVLGLAAVCVGEQPSLRPSMAEVMRVLRERLPSSVSAVHLKSDGLDEL